MNKNTSTFIESLDLPSPGTQSLATELGDDPSLEAFLNSKNHDKSALTRLACLSARLCLGADSVDTAPVNQSDADGNWFGHYPSQNRQILILGSRSQACWQNPSCIVSPSSADEVSKILKIVNFFQTKFAVRSGGHSPSPGWSSIDEAGILIDLRKLNQVTVSADQKIASLGPGGRWGDIFAALDPYGVSVIGGRIPQVGVGGLMLGGSATPLTQRS